MKVRVGKKKKQRETGLYGRGSHVNFEGDPTSRPGMLEEHAKARRWVPWICAYTGARVNEIAGRIEDEEGYFTALQVSGSE
ncbi:MAG: hypothetical protein JHD07_31860 [Bradyrhizobium sp.]|nr:hypothetical protein [Bradyrhizobium sp.]